MGQEIFMPVYSLQRGKPNRRLFALLSLSSVHGGGGGGKTGGGGFRMQGRLEQESNLCRRRLRRELRRFMLKKQNRFLPSYSLWADDAAMTIKGCKKLHAVWFYQHEAVEQLNSTDLRA